MIEPKTVTIHTDGPGVYRDINATERAQYGGPR